MISRQIPAMRQAHPNATKNMTIPPFHKSVMWLFVGTIPRTSVYFDQHC
jgi:hypothetical protein